MKKVGAQHISGRVYLPKVTAAQPLGCSGLVSMRTPYGDVETGGILLDDMVKGAIAETINLMLGHADWTIEQIKAESATAIAAAKASATPAKFAPHPPAGPASRRTRAMSRLRHRREVGS